MKNFLILFLLMSGSLLADNFSQEEMLTQAVLRLLVISKSNSGEKFSENLLRKILPGEEYNTTAKETKDSNPPINGGTQTTEANFKIYRSGENAITIKSNAKIIVKKDSSKLPDLRAMGRPIETHKMGPVEICDQHSKCEYSQEAKTINGTPFFRGHECLKCTTQIPLEQFKAMLKKHAE